MNLYAWNGAAVKCEGPWRATHCWERKWSLHLRQRATSLGSMLVLGKTLTFHRTASKNVIVLILKLQVKHFFIYETNIIYIANKSLHSLSLLLWFLVQALDFLLQSHCLQTVCYPVMILFSFPVFIMDPVSSPSRICFSTLPFIYPFTPVLFPWSSHLFLSLSQVHCCSISFISHIFFSLSTCFLSVPPQIP